MFKIGDAVFYGVHGVCRIEERSKREFCGKLCDYYTLKPVYTSRNTVFIQVDKAAEKLRKVMQKSEVLKIIDGLCDSQSVWIDDDAKRKEIFAEIIKNGTRKDMAILIKTIFEKRKDYLEIKKKMHATDERFLEEAEKILHEEFAYALNIPREQVTSFVAKRLGKE